MPESERRISRINCMSNAQSRGSLKTNTASIFRLEDGEVGFMGRGRGLAKLL